MLSVGSTPQASSPLFCTQPSSGDFGNLAGDGTEVARVPDVAPRAAAAASAALVLPALSDRAHIEPGCVGTAAMSADALRDAGLNPAGAQLSSVAPSAALDAPTTTDIVPMRTDVPTNSVSPTPSATGNKNDGIADIASGSAPAAGAHTMPIAAGMLDDFLSMTKSRAVSCAARKKAGDEVASEAQAPQVEEAQREADRAKKARTAGEPGSGVEVKVDHESTRCTYRVRLLVRGAKVRSKGIRYDEGDAASKHKACEAASALAGEWRKQQA